MSTAKRFSSVSFSKSEQDMQDDENFQLSLAPHVQTYLSQMSQAAGCWGKCLPIPFERAATKSWWDPTFDSEVLEEQFKKSAAPNNRLKFRYAIWYVLLISLTWFFYFLTMGLLNSTELWPILCGVLTIIALSSIAIMVLTYRDFFNAYIVFLSFGIAVILCILSLMFLTVIPIMYGSSKATTTISPACHFSICIEILLLIYTILPLRLYMCITIGVVYSTVFELLTWLTDEQSYELIAIIVRILVHLCIHLIGLHILIMSNVRMRDTFMQVGQSLLVGQQLKAEKNLKESMLHSLMPPQVAEWLMGEDEHFAKTGKEGRDSSETGDMKTLFRPFNMNRMENVSILFADIVGFTKISSTKTAEELVDILNQLFQKFDILCKQSQCEKISTLGDCYYCVSGCPQPRPDHAKCCVEMGLGMIQVIKQFDQEHNQGVNMRVGVHTGTVLCGIVGTKRFKFDVWSNDVTLANKMESSGRPGMVHISEKTYEFLEDMYITEDGQSEYGLKTYFIIRRKHETPLSTRNSVRKKPQIIQAQPQLFQHQPQLAPLTPPPPPPSQSEKEHEDTQKSQTPSLQLIISPPTTPPVTSPQIRPRVLSCDNSATHFKISHNPNMLSPDVCKMKASSLPSILDEQELEAEKDSGEGSDAIKTPTSTASSGRYSVKIKNWKIPNFLRKSDAQKTEDQSQTIVSCIEPLLNNAATYKQVPRIIETQHQKDDDPIDVKSYISQSRSDIGQYDFAANELSNFIRSGSRSSSQEYSVLTRAESNRSRRGHSPNFDIVPVERSRSATVAIPPLDRPKRSLDVPHRLSSIFLDDQVSTTYSINSRKDSGIKSNSRRSSIQIENHLPLTDNGQQRMSDYFTSSQSSITASQTVTGGAFLEKFGRSIQNLRKQSDLQLIRCVQKNSESDRSYFIEPQLSKLTLFFEDQKLEQEYRENVHSLSERDPIATLANSRFNTYFDVFVSTVVFVVISISLFISYELTILWLVVFVILCLVQVCAIALCVRRFVEFSEDLFSFCSRWYGWNAFGGTLVSVPIIAVLCNFVCSRLFFTANVSDYLYSYLLCVGIVHFCNFTQLNCWMKNCLATCFGVIFICLILSGICPCHVPNLELTNSSVTLDQNLTLENLTLVASTVTMTPVTDLYLYNWEILIDVLLLLVLIWLLNREFEISYRLSFHASFVANRDKLQVQRLKTQADWLIYNIVPEHVAVQLKKNAKYSENFKDVAVIFASIVNFNEMYDESYLGGKEFLRVLNELIGDFDELLTLPEFQSVEKIKTIGSTFMAASGLNSKMRLEQSDPHAHLFALMEFSLAMQKVIDNFNGDLIEFNLILRTGYNFGDVTAAVIGNTKMYYDIWGDAVNIASRMDSTGVSGRIQVGEQCLGVLEKRYIFEPRGSMYVKGKGDMNLFLLVDRRDENEIAK